MIDYDGLERDIGYIFQNRDLAEESLTHPSFHISQIFDKSYERMEFLGDSVLALIVSDILYKLFPKEPEGDLAKRRSALVCWESLADIAKSISLDKYMKLSLGEEKNGGRSNISNLENTFEALIAAIYLDGGFNAAQEFVERIFAPLARATKTPPKDPKTALQEWAQAKGLAIPEYVTISQDGPSHAPSFVIEVRVDGQVPKRAKGTSKKAAAKDAAQELLDKLEQATIEADNG